jgi:hypothetical protein
LSAHGHASGGAHGDVGPEGAEGGPTEEELRAYEEELSRISATDMIAQVSVSLLNLGARRLAPPSDAAAGGADRDPADRTHPQRDLEQARDAIDAARALLEILERRIPGDLGPLRDALSRLQMSYAREVSAPAADTAGQPPQAPGSSPPAGSPPATQEQPGGDPSHGPGPAESSGRLWVPGR